MVPKQDWSDSGGKAAPQTTRAGGCIPPPNLLEQGAKGRRAQISCYHVEVIQSWVRNYIPGGTAQRIAPTPPYQGTVYAMGTH
jgi:hypothetical protein